MWSVTNIDTFSREIQEHFTDGLALVIGSGLSAGEGLPTMWHLSEQLRAEVPKLLPSPNESWEKIEKLLAAEINLEEALTSAVPDQEVEEIIVKITADFIQLKEGVAIKSAVEGSRVLKLTTLLKNILLTSEGLPIITTNYDRLVEVAVEAAGMGADTGFVVYASPH